VSASVTTQHANASGVIDLARGDPHPEFLPLERVRAAAALVTAGADPAVLQYGYEPGDLGVREQLAALLGRYGGAAPSPDALFVTAGASMALDLACALYAEPGARVLVANPTYHLALAVLADRGLQVEAVASDADGIDPDALEAALQRGPAAFVYLVPAHGNPTGVSLPPERRDAVLALARRYGVRIVADEVYRLTAFGAGDADPSAARIVAGLADVAPDVALSLGSFSKLLSPGLRLGWLQGPPDDLARLARRGLLRSGGGLNPFTAALVRQLLADGGFDAHLAFVRARLRARHDTLLAAVRRQLGAARVRPATGGYFLWLDLERVDVTAPTFTAALEQAQVRVAQGAQFVPVGAELGAARSCLRLCFASAAEADLPVGIARLTDSVRRVDSVYSLP